MAALSGRVACTGRVTAITTAYRGDERDYRGKVVLVEGTLTPVIALAVQHAAGVVASEGGITSHGANLLREFNVPCLIGVDVSQIEAGAEVKLDCVAGLLRIPSARRFRYLIAVPYTAHGSDISDYVETDTPEGLRVTVRPKVPVNYIDYTLLARGFERIPCDVLGLEVASFSFERRDGSITYTRFPKPREAFLKLADASLARNYLAERNSIRGVLYSALRETSLTLDAADARGYARAAGKLVRAFASNLPTLMTSALVDEYAFEDALAMIQRLPEDLREEAFRVVLQSPFTRVAAQYAPEVLALKRITVPLGTHFCADASAIQSVDRRANKPLPTSLRRRSGFTPDEVRRLEMASALYNHSEELLVLWGSFISQLSVLITRWMVANRPDELTLVKSSDIDRLLVRMEGGST